MHGSDPAPSTDDGTRRSRPAGSRRGLPSGRAVVGGLLVTMAAVVVFAAYAGAQERPSTTVVVAKTDLEPGAVLTEADVEERVLDVPTEIAGRAFSDSDAVVGAVTLGPIGAGELVQAGAVRAGDAEPGTTERPVEFSFPIEKERALGGDVRPGEEVDVLATYGSGADASTVVLARRARVLHVQDPRTGTLGSSGRLVLTVGLTSDDEVLDLAHASQVAALTLVRPRGDGAGSAASVGTTTVGPNSTSGAAPGLGRP